jgi:hypothetical protein
MPGASTAPAVSPSPDPDENPVTFLDTASNAITEATNSPLLVLYYPPYARMSESDLEDVYNAFRATGVTPDEKLDTLDVLIESYGGDPVAGYRLAQLIRDFAGSVRFLVAAHAYSAATILCFSGNEIRLGHYAGLSPIDITLVSESGEQPRAEVELASIDSFLDFAVKAREKTERLLKKLGSKNTTNIDSNLLVAMVQEIGALSVGKYFRERNLTGNYAQELLDSYMLPSHLDAKHRSQSLVHNFLFGAPSHHFHLDYHLCRKLGLVVHEMSTDEFDRAKRCIEVLESLAESSVICQRISPALRLPFFRFYPVGAAAPAEAATEVPAQPVQLDGAAITSNGKPEKEKETTTNERPKEEPEPSATGT